MGSSPDSACAAGGAPSGKGVAGATGEGAASPYRAKACSGREPTRVGSCPDLACAAGGAQGCMALPGQSRATQGGHSQDTPGNEGVAGPTPRDSGEGTPLPAGRSPGQAGSPLGWDPAEIQPAHSKPLQAAWASPGRSSGKQGWARDIPRFSPRIDWIFPCKALNPLFGAQDEDFSKFRSR